jgi:hypothetical protein
MQTPSPDDLALNRRITIGTSIDAKVRERLVISASDRPTPMSEFWFMSFALAGGRWIVPFLAAAELKRVGQEFAKTVGRWIVLLLFQYPMRHPSGYRGWLRETGFVTAIVVAAIAGAVLRRWY